MTNTIPLSIPAHVYLQQLRALGAWWKLGSSAIDPELLIQYATSHEGRTTRTTWASTPADALATETRGVD